MQSVFSRCVFFLRPFLWSILAFLICGNCLQTLQNVLQQMGNRITILGSIKHPTPRMAKKLFMLYFNPYALGAPASDDLSVFEKKEDICYSFILSKLVYHFTMVTLQKHHYTNNPTTKNTFIIAHVAILMAREGICILYMGIQKYYNIDSNYLLSSLSLKQWEYCELY